MSTAIGLPRRLLRFDRAAGRLLGGGVALESLGGLAAVAQAWLFSHGVTDVFLLHRSPAAELRLLVILAVVVAVRAGLGGGAELSAARGAARLKLSLRRRLFDHLLNLGPAFVHEERTGELVGLATEGLDAVETYLARYVPQLVSAVLVPVTVLVAVFPQDPVSGFVLLLTGPLVPFFMVLIGKTADTETRKQWRSLSRLGAHFLDVVQGLTTLKLFGRTGQETSRLARVNEEFRKVTMRVLRLAFLSAFTLELLATLSTALVAVTIGLRLLHGRMAFQPALMILVLAPEFYHPLRALGARFHAGLAGVAAADRLFGVLAEVPLTELEGARRQGASPPVGDAALCLEKVSVTRRDGREVLRDVSFRLEPGTHTALVGPSGAGKTTVTHLLLRFLAPTSGRLTVGGKPLEETSRAAWWEQVAWVSPTPHLFAGTVSENLRLVRPEATFEQLMEAAKAAGAHGFITALPHGYDTPLGERGVRLSAGQVQRIALARAFLKDAPLLILDEPTAHLDAESEKAVQETLARLRRGRTTLTVAHRLHTLREADHLVVLDNGRVSEQGPPAVLMNRKGLYHHLLAAGRQSEPTSPSPAYPPLSLRYELTPEARSASRAWVGPRPESEPVPSTLRQLLSLAAPLTGRLAGSALLGAATVLSGVGLMTTAAYLLSAAALHPPLGALSMSIVGVRFFGLIRGAFRYAERLVSHEVTFRLLARLRDRLFRCLADLAPQGLAGYHSGDLLKRLVSEVDALQSFFLQIVWPPAVAVLAAIVVLSFLAQFTLTGALATLALMAAAGVGLPLASRLLSRQKEREVVTVASQLHTRLVDTVQGMAEVLVAGRRSDWLQQLGSLDRGLVDGQQHGAAVQAAHHAAANLLARLSLPVVVAVAARLVPAGHLDGIVVAALALAALAAFEAMETLPAAFQPVDGMLASASRLFELEHLPSPVHPPPRPSPRPHTFSLSVRGLSFRYTPAAPLVLRDVNFTVAPGERVALIGPSGAGKTTLLWLLVRFLEYEHGRILFGGYDLHEFEPDVLRHYLAVVPQRPHLFNATMRDNLLLARASATAEQLDAAVTAAGLHEFLATQPEGYDMWVGEHGLRLSTGERQRVALAQALLRETPVLLLDEPTAQVDPVTARGLLDTILGLERSRLVLVITHDLTGVEAFDRILVLADGTIVQHGRHDELMAQEGLYRRLWNLQFTDGVPGPASA